MAKRIFISLMTITLACFISIEQGYCETVALKSAGCKTEIFLLKDLSEAYQAQTGKAIRLGGTGNKKAIDLLLDQKVDFTFTCKPINELSKGMKLDKEQVSSWKSIALAKDPIVIVANTNNQITNVTSDELTKIFLGQHANWKELNGSDLPVLPAYLSTELESGVVLLFKEYTVGSKGQLTDNAMKANTPSMLGNYTSVTPGAISFMSYNSYDEKYGNIVKVDGVQPNVENILNGTYPLAATYFITIDERKNQAVAEFINFTKSKAGQHAINKNYIFISE